MKNNIFNNVFAFLLALSMLLSVCGGCVFVGAETANSTTSSSDGAWKLMAQDEKLKLFLNRETTNFYVEDAASGNRFYAFPEDTSVDSVATPAYQIEMQSTLVFTLWDPVKKTESRKNTKAASVNGKSFTVREQNGGFFIDYNLKTSGISATLSVTLKDGKLYCTIPANSVKEADVTKCQVLRIAVLPYMISGMKNTDGQIILPDGCGEILDFSTTRVASQVYQKPIYGRNLSMNLSVEEKMGYDITTPYIALCKSSNGILSIPTSGAAIGYVNANGAGKLSDYANAYYSFQYRASDIAIIGDKASKTAQSTVVIDENAYDKDITVSYQFIFENADIYSLAKLYGQYLAPASKASVKSDETAVFDIYGFVNEKKSFFGFPYTAQSVLSNGEDIIALSNDNDYQNIIINLKNITKNQQNDCIDTNVKPIKKVLSGKELKKLLSGKNGVFVDVNPLLFKKNTLKINNFFSASKTLYGAPINLYEFKESTHLIDKNVGKSYLLKFKLIEGIAGDIANSAKKLSLDGVYSNQLASLSYHDYENGGTLEDTHNAQEKACEVISKATALTLSNPFDYAIKYCSMLTDIPTDSSNNDLCVGSYPFIQMALGDSIPYTTQEVNLNRSPETAFLHAISSGARLHWGLTLTENEPLIGSELNFLYSADYDTLEPQIKKHYADWQKVYAATKGSALVNYEINQNGTVSTFENGAKIMVNLSEKTFSISQ